MLSIVKIKLRYMEITLTLTLYSRTRNPMLIDLQSPINLTLIIHMYQYNKITHDKIEI